MIKLTDLYIKSPSLPTTQAGLNFGTWDPNADNSIGITFGVNSQLIIPITNTLSLENTVLDTGEIVFNTTSSSLTVGDGKTLGGIPVGSNTSSSSLGLLMTIFN